MQPTQTISRASSKKREQAITEIAIAAVENPRFTSIADAKRQRNPKRDANTFGALSIILGHQSADLLIVSARNRRGLSCPLVKALIK